MGVAAAHGRTAAGAVKPLLTDANGRWLGSVDSIGTPVYTFPTGAPTAGQITVLAAAATLLAAGAGNLASRKILVIRPAAAIYIGPAGVTTANGFLVPANEAFVIELNPATDVSFYGRAAADTTCYVLEVA